MERQSRPSCGCVRREQARICMHCQCAHCRCITARTCKAESESASVDSSTWQTEMTRGSGKRSTVCGTALGNLNTAGPHLDVRHSGPVQSLHLWVNLRRVLPPRPEQAQPLTLERLLRGVPWSARIAGSCAMALTRTGAWCATARPTFCAPACKLHGTIMLPLRRRLPDM